MLSSDATKVVCVGVSLYRRRDLTLSYAAQNARAFSAALTAKGGCAIPVGNLSLLTDDDATAQAVVASLLAAARACTADDVLIFYFSGHGEREGDTFYLLPTEAKLDLLSETAVSAQWLREALEGCAARGVLLILDCCKSAGFAENADTFFRTLGSQEFRILLSASRAGQSSYEFKSQKGTIFSRRLTEPILGEPVLGEQPGVVYFSDLFAFLQKQLAEDLETLGYPPQAQEPVFAGTYARDPRLFILRQVTLDAIEAQTPRYSRKFVTRSRNRALVAAAFALLLTSGFYYYYLDHSTYIATVASTIGGFEGNYLAVFAGDPRFNAFGFPHLRDTTDVPASALADAGQPAIIARLGGDLYGSLRASLPDEWNAVLAGWKGDVTEAARLIKIKDDDIDLPDDPAGLKVAVDILGELDGQRSQELLEENAPPIAPGRAAVALRHIAAFDPQRALDLYQDGMEGNAELQLALLQGLRGGCPDDAKEVLGKLAHVTYDLNQGKSMWVDPEPRRAAWWGALIRAGCSLPSEGFIKLYDNEVYRDNDRDFNVMAYMLHNHDPAVLDWIKRDIEQLAPTELAGHKSANWLTDFEREIRLWSDMRILAATRTSFDQALILRLTAFDLDKDIKIGAGRLLLSDPSFDRSLLLRGSAGDAWILALLVDDGWFDEALVRDTVRSTIRRSTPNLGSNFSDSLKYLTKMIRRRHVAAAAEVVKEIGETAPDPDVRVEASLTLDAISPKQVRQAKRSRRSDFFDRLDSGNLFALPKPATSASLGDSYRYYVSRYDQGFDDFMKSFGKSAWDDARFLGRTPLSASGLAELRALLSKPTTKLSSAAVLAMAANEEDLLGILSSPDIELRQEALKYAAYNSALPNLVSSQTLAATGRQTQFYLTRQIKLKGFIEEALRDERLISKGLVLKILLAGSVNVSPGLELWAADVLDSLDGQVEDGAGELVLFDAH